MRLPAVTFQVGLPGSGFITDLCRRTAFERSMKTALVVLVLERLKLSLQVDSIPEQRVVKKLTTNSPDQAFHEGV